MQLLTCGSEVVRRCRLLVPVLLLAMVGPAANAADIVPDVLTDDVSDNGNCTLREAVLAANYNVPRDLCPAGEIGLDRILLGADTYVLSIAGSGEDYGSTGDLDVEDDLEIRGVGADATVIAQTAVDRVIHLNPDFYGGPTLGLSGLTVTGGDEPGTNIFDHGGGAVRVVSGILTLRRVAVTGNSTVSGGGGVLMGDGAIEHSTISGNTALGEGPTPGLGGGGLVVAGAVAIVNSTISGNTASGGSGGGISAPDLGVTLELTLIQVTLSDNTAAGVGSAIAVEAQDADIANSLIDGECDGPLDSLGGNVESPGDSCGLAGTGDQVAVATGQLALGPLADNLGPTETHALLGGSVAIDAALASSCTPTDQRGLGRPAHQCDVGAFELGSWWVFFDDFESGGVGAWSDANS